MKAALLRAYAAPPELAEHPRPIPPAGGALVQVRAAPIAPLDRLCASGASYFGEPPLPYVPGVQGVGVVAESDAYAVGTRVWFATGAGMAPGDGSLAEWCAVPGPDLVPISADVPDADRGGHRHLGHRGLDGPDLAGRAAGGRAGGGARRQRGGGPGGHGGGPGARRRARWSPSSARRPPGPGSASAGAHAVVVLDPAEERTALTGRLVAAADGPVDVVVDPVFGEAAAAAVLALGPGGRLVNLGGSASDAAEFSSAALRGRSLSILGYTNNAISAEQRAEALTSVLALAARGVVAVDHRVLPLAECDQAWTLAGTPGPRVVVAVS